MAVSSETPVVQVTANSTIAAPSQTGQAGKFLSTDGTALQWADVDAFPDQTGNAGEYLTTDGTNVAWAPVDALPDQTGAAGEFLTTDGTNASWAALEGLPSVAGIEPGSTLVTNIDPQASPASRWVQPRNVPGQISDSLRYFGGTTYYGLRGSAYFDMPPYQYQFVCGESDAASGWVAAVQDDDVIWSKTIPIGAGTGARMHAIGVDSLGYVYVAGRITGADARQGYLAKIEPDTGNLVWARDMVDSVTSTLDVQIYGLRVLDDDCVVVSVRAETATGYVPVVVKFSQTGEVIYKTRFTGSTNFTDVYSSDALWPMPGGCVLVGVYDDDAYGGGAAVLIDATGNAHTVLSIDGAVSSLCIDKQGHLWLGNRYGNRLIRGMAGKVWKAFEISTTGVCDHTPVPHPIEGVYVLDGVNTDDGDPSGISSKPGLWHVDWDGQVLGRWRAEWLDTGTIPTAQLYPDQLSVRYGQVQIAAWTDAWASALLTVNVKNTTQHYRTSEVAAYDAFLEWNPSIPTAALTDPDDVSVSTVWTVTWADDTLLAITANTDALVTDPNTVDEITRDNFGEVTP